MKICNYFPKTCKDIKSNLRLLIYLAILILLVVSLAFGVSVIRGEILSYENIRDYAFDIGKLIGGATFIIAIFNLGLNRKKFNFDVIESCIKRFKEIYSELSEANENNDREKIQRSLDQYVHLVNEELFYIANGYIPEEVSREWIDGMIDFLPVFTKEGKPINKKKIEFKEHFAYSVAN